MIYLLLFIAAGLSYFFKKLTLTGAITGFTVSAFIIPGTGYPGITLLAVFFISATLASRSHGERRTAGQVLANGGIAAILSLCAWECPQYQILFQFMLAGSLASATADTLSSELGTVYGRNFINIITLKKDEKGLDGVVSLEGTLVGIIGAVLIALTYAAFNGFTLAFVFIIIAGFTGNLADSILGAALERKGLIGNNIVNFLNTAIGALVCLALIYL